MSATLSYRSFPIEIRQSTRRRKTISLSINQQGIIVISVPGYYPKVAAKLLLRQNRPALDRLIRRYQKKGRKIDPLANLSVSSSIKFLGEKYYLQVESASLPQLPKKKDYTYHLGEKILFILVQEDKINSIDSQYLRQIVMDFYFEQAQQILEQRTKHWASQMQVTYKKVHIKNVKTLWGSCSARKNLTYKWAIIIHSPTVVDYLVIHELCHLIHRNHSKRFWQEVGKYDQDYKEHRRELRHS